MTKKTRSHQSSQDRKKRLQELRGNPLPPVTGSNMSAVLPTMRALNPRARLSTAGGGSSLNAPPLHPSTAQPAPFRFVIDPSDPRGVFRVEPTSTPSSFILYPKAPDEHASDWPGKPPYVVYRKCALRENGGSPATGIDMKVLGPDPLGANAPAQPGPAGYETETYDTFAEAYRAARMTVDQVAIRRWMSDLQAERDRRELNRREELLKKTGSAELPEERKNRHYLQWLDTNLSKRAYSTLHHGEDSLDAEAIRRLLADPA